MEDYIEIFVRPVVVSNRFVQTRLSSRAGRFIVWGLPSDLAYHGLTHDAEQPLMKIAKITWLSAIELRQSFHNFDEVAAVVES